MRFFRKMTSKIITDTTITVAIMGIAQSAYLSFTTLSNYFHNSRYTLWSPAQANEDQTNVPGNDAEKQKRFELS